MKNKKAKNLVRNNSLLKGLVMIAIYFVAAFVLEMINFNALGFGVLPTNVLFDLAFLLIVCGLIFLIPNNTAKLVVEAVLILVQVVLNVVNSVLIKYTGLVFHFQLLLQLGNGMESLESDMIDAWLVIAYILIFIVVLVSLIILNVKMKKGVDFKFNKRIAFWLSCAFGAIVVGSSFVFIGNTIKTNVQKNAYSFAADGGASVDSGVYFKNATMKTMGTFGFYFHNFNWLFDAGAASDAEKTLMKTEIEKTYVDDENMFKIAENDNLIYILLESFDEFAIDPYNTPNLYKLAYGVASEESDKNVKWGYNFSSFHGLNYTNNSEYISLLGHTTEKDSLSSYYHKNGLTTPYSLPNLFKNAKYEKVNYFHGYSKEYYERDEIYKAIGFDNVYGLEDSSMENKSVGFGDWVLDSDYISSMLSKFIPEGSSFFSYYASISTHGPYYNTTNSRFDSYKTKYDKNLENYKKYLDSQGYVYPEDAETQQQLKNYKSAVMDTDLMIEIIFTELARQNILESTTIVLFSDHYCFYSELNGKIKNIETRDFDNIDLYNIPMIIYNDEIAARSSTAFCNTYDLYPTICDMFGFEYYSAITPGYSVFDDDIKNSVHVSFKHGVFNQDYYTEDLIEIKQVSQNPIMTVDEFKKQAYQFFVKQEKIEFVYRNNLYKI